MRNPESDLSGLIAAHGLIEHGWIQRTFEINDRVCMLGAISKACGGASDTRSRESRRLIRMVVRELPLKFRVWPVIGRVRVVLFNDYNKRTKKEVLLVFEKAISRQLARAEKPHLLQWLVKRILLGPELAGPRPHRKQIVGPADIAATDGVARQQWIDQRRVDRVEPNAGPVKPKQLTPVDF